MINSGFKSKGWVMLLPGKSNHYYLFKRIEVVLVFVVFFIRVERGRDIGSGYLITRR